MELTRGAQRTAFGSGQDLELLSEDSPARASLGNAGRQPNPHAGKTLFIESHTSYFSPGTLAEQLPKRPEYAAWGLKIVQERSVADLIITIDRPLLTYNFTFVLSERKSSVVVTSGKVVALDGLLAAPGLAKTILQQWGRAQASAHAGADNVM